MRIRYALFFLTVIGVAASAQEPGSPAQPLANTASSVLARMMPSCFLAKPAPSADTVVVVSNCWQQKIKPLKDTATRFFTRCGMSRINTEPLVVIDGISFELAHLKDINPNDIESIEILKGAKAAAIFGARGYAGVILITTKKTTTRVFEILDAQDQTKLEGASVVFTAVTGRQSLSFAADRDGLVMTDKLHATSYELEVSMVGYKNARLQWKAGETTGKKIMLEKNIKECGPVVMITYHTIRCRCLSCGSKSVREMNVPIKKQTTESVLKIFPNPLQKGQSFTIELESPVTGAIDVKMISADGRQLMTRSFNNVEGSGRVVIETDNRWAAGVYFIQVHNNAGGHIRTEQVIIL